MVKLGINNQKKIEIVDINKIIISNLPIFKKQNFVFLEDLGEGGFGRVQKAFLKTEGTYVALKFYKIKEEQTETEVLDEISLEDHLLRKVDSILQKDKQLCFFKYYGIFRNSKPKKGDFPVILQMKSGTISLVDMLKAGKLYDADEIIWILRVLVKGFLTLQENFIAHRDIKPDNIIL